MGPHQIQFLVALLATQLVLHLHGAGLRRPFGSVASVSFLPQWLRRADSLVFAIDCVITIYVILMWILLARELGLLATLVFGTIFSAIGDFLSARISLVWSLYLTVTLLAVGSVALFQPAVFFEELGLASIFF